MVLVVVKDTTNISRIRNSSSSFIKHIMYLIEAIFKKHCQAQRLIPSKERYDMEKLSFLSQSYSQFLI